MDKNYWYTKKYLKNIYDLIDKEIRGKFKTNNSTNEQIKKYKRHGLELINDKKFVYAYESIIIPVIMHCRTQESCKFKRNLGFKLHDTINCKEQIINKRCIWRRKYANSNTVY